MKQVPTAANHHATTEELLETVFSVIRAAAVATQPRGKHIYAATNPDKTIEELCLLCPCKGVIRRTIEGRVVQLAGSRSSEGSREIAIVRSRYQEMSSEDTAGWERLRVICTVWKSAIVL
jgi:hypothetical protein